MKRLLFETPGLLLLVAIHISLGSLVGALFPPGAWLESLIKPGFYPPTWAFPVAWTFLYACMGASLWFVVRSRQGPKRLALWVYSSQLAVNLAYTPLCFGLESTLLGLLDVSLLLIILLATMIQFRKISLTAAALLVPYLLWVSFALVLSISIWELNP